MMKGMKPIEVRKQVKLGAGRCLRLALTGMSYRLFRSGVTVAILALAVAFLVHMLAHGLMEGRVQGRAWSLLAADRASGELLTRLSAPDGRSAVLARLAKAAEGDGVGWSDDPRLAEYRRWAGAGVIEGARGAAGSYAVLIAYLEAVPEKQRVVLTGGLEGVTLMDRLARPGELERFDRAVGELSLSPPLEDRAGGGGGGGEGGLRGLVREGWPVLLGAADAVAAGQAGALRRVRSSYQEASAATLLESRPEGLGAVLASAGFEVEEADLAAASRFTRDERDLAAVGRSLNIESVRRAVAKELNVPPPLVSLEATMDWLTRGARAELLLEVVKPVAGTAGDPVATAALLSMTPQRLLELASDYRGRRTLREAVGDVGDQSPRGADEGFWGMPQRSLWLILLSALVCMIGVANAMLMSVTERFTEIATMKCLGAMDGFVMNMFVFEAMIQGLVGGVLGAVLGLVLAVVRVWLEYGSLAWFAVGATGPVLWATLGSLVVGLLLATLAAVGPSFVAARLAPMEAMRVE